jgi:cell division protein FtsA
MKKGLGRTRSGLIAALDVGSSKTCCFIARMGEDWRPRVVGIGQQASQGLRLGTVVDLDAATQSIGKAVHAAEQMAGEQVDSVVVNLSGGGPSSRTVSVEVAISGHEIGQADVRRAIDECHALDGQAQGDAAGRQLIHSIPISYQVDGSRGIRDPRGMYGERLAVDLHTVSAATGALRNLSTCIERAHLQVGGVVVSPYASGLAALVEDEMELGVTLVEMGGGTTSMAVFFEGNVIYTDVLPVGGNHVTNDIARGLSTPRAHAERMKTLYGHAMATAADEREMIDVPQVGEDETTGIQQVPRSLLVGIIQPRVEETFELVRNRLEASGFDRVAGRRVVLTGGACQLPGLRELASLVLDKQVRVGRPLRVRGLADVTSGPTYATCAGLLTYAVAANLTQPQPGGRGEDDKNAAKGSDGPIRRLGHWLKEHF